MAYLSVPGAAPGYQGYGYRGLGAGKSDSDVAPKTSATSTSTKETTAGSKTAYSTPQQQAQAAAYAAGAQKSTVPVPRIIPNAPAAAPAAAPNYPQRASPAQIAAAEAQDRMIRGEVAPGGGAIPQAQVPESYYVPPPPVALRQSQGLNRSGSILGPLGLPQGFQSPAVATWTPFNWRPLVYGAAALAVIGLVGVIVTKVRSR